MLHRMLRTFKFPLAAIALIAMLQALPAVAAETPTPTIPHTGESRPTVSTTGNPAAPAAADAHPTGDHADGDHAAGEHEKGSLVPDMSRMSSWISALWVVIIFLILLAVLYPTAWKNVLAGLKAREQRIRQDIADAEAARVKADATLKEYSAKLTAAADEARATVAAASAEAERVAATIRARGETEATEAKNRAIREIEAARKQALSEIYEQAAQLATSVAEKIIRRSLTADDQRDLVARSLEELQGVGRE